MRLLTYSISALAGLLAALVVVAAISVRSTPATIAQPVAATDFTAPTVTQQAPPALPPRPWNAPPPPLKFKELDAAGLAKLLGGPDVVAVLDRAERVTSVLLKLPQNHTIPPSRIPPKTREVVVAAEAAAHVRELLFDPAKNRQVDAMPGCAPQFGWRLSYFGNGRRVDFYFCFGCGHLAVDLDGFTVGRCLIGGVGKELEKVMDSIDHGDPLPAPPDEADAPVIPVPPVPGVP